MTHLSLLQTLDSTTSPDQRITHSTFHIQHILHVLHSTRKFHNMSTNSEKIKQYNMSSKREQALRIAKFLKPEYQQQFLEEQEVTLEKSRDNNPTTIATDTTIEEITLDESPEEITLDETSEEITLEESTEEITLDETSEEITLEESSECTRDPEDLEDPKDLEDPEYIEYLEYLKDPENIKYLEYLIATDPPELIFHIEDHEDEQMIEVANEVSRGTPNVMTPSLRVIYSLKRFPEHLEDLPKHNRTAEMQETDAIWSFLFYFCSWKREYMKMKKCRTFKNETQKTYVSDFLKTFKKNLMRDIRRYPKIITHYTTNRKEILRTLRVQHPHEGTWPYMNLNCIKRCSNNCEHQKVSV